MHKKVQENFSQCMEHCYKKKKTCAVVDPKNQIDATGVYQAYLRLVEWNSKINLFAVGKKYRKKIYPLHKLASLGRLEIHIALSNPNINVRIGSLDQGCCHRQFILTLSLILKKMKYSRPCYFQSSKKLDEVKDDRFCSSLQIPTRFGVIPIGGVQSIGAFIRELSSTHLIQFLQFRGGVYYIRGVYL